MTRDDVRREILGAVARIAPEIDPASIDPAANLRDQCDLDSMDFLHIMIALHEGLGVSIPEADYAKLLTLDSAVDYLAARVAPARGSSASAIADREPGG